MPNNRTIKYDKLPSGVVISTVLLKYTELLPYETMVFPSEENFSDLDVERYDTKAEAVEGHKRIYKKWALKENVHLSIWKNE